MNTVTLTIRKSFLLFYMLIGSAIIVSAQSKDEKKRIKTIEKSLEKKNCLIFQDTVYYCGKAALLIKKQPDKTEKISSLSGIPLFEMEIANMSTGSILSISKFTFWIKFENIKETIRYESKGAYAEMIQEMIEKGVLKNGLLENGTLNTFVQQYKAAKINYQIKNNCSLAAKIVVNNAKQIQMDNYSLSANYEESHEAAIGDTMCFLDSNGKPINCIELKVDGKSISINSYCTGLVVQ